MLLKQTVFTGLAVVHNIEKLFIELQTIIKPDKLYLVSYLGGEINNG
jgi:hypothetical protein